MAEYILSITSEKNLEFQTDLFATNFDVFQEDIVNLLDTDKSHVLNAMNKYEFTISPCMKDYSAGYIYINGTQPCIDDFGNVSLYYYNAEESVFKMLPGNQKAAFSDIWGYVQIHIRLESSDGHFDDFYTKYIEIDNAAVNMSDMASLVYRGFPELLAKNGILKSKTTADINQMAEVPLDLKLDLIKKIARVYDQNYNFFMTNSRSTTKQVERVDKLEKLNYVTAGALQYTVQHPEELYQVHTFNGIKIGRHVYHPRHTKTITSVISYDIYENHVIVDFLSQALNKLDGIEQTLQELLDNNKSNFLLLFEHLFSRDYINSKIPDIQSLKQHLVKLVRKYSSALNIKPEIMKKTPLATHIFMEIPQYREIFGCIREWYRGVYDFEQSRFLLHCIGSSRLYESFVLTEILQYIQIKGFTIDANKYEYDVLDDLYSNTTFNNTFTCTNENCTITVYYQPVVYSDNRSLNGIHLIKTRGGSSVGYYTPDYIFKIERSHTKGEQYIICDAKFSNLETVKNQSFKNVIYKYENGIEALPNANISNQCVVYGKYDSRDPLVVLYGETNVFKDKDNSYSPVATIIPISYELLLSDPEGFYSNLDRLIRI